MLDGTHDDTGLAPPIPFDPPAAGAPVLGEDCFQSIDAVDLGADAPAWLTSLTRMIRPISVGALMAIPTVGAATVGLVAAFDAPRGLAMAAASVAFLQGLPVDIVILIGTLATGYGFAKSIERIKGARK